MLGALLMTTAAGLSTGIGGLVVLLCKRPTERMLAFSLGFAGGVMITVSLSDMLPHAVSGYLEVMERPQAAGGGAESLFDGDGDRRPAAPLSAGTAFGKSGPAAGGKECTAADTGGQKCCCHHRGDPDA